MKPHGLFARCVLTLVAVAAVSERALATWSIVAVNVRTGEVCVASATCLTGDLERLLPVVVPGVGVAAAQSFVDVSGKNRKLIQTGLLAGLSPQEILDQLAATDLQHQTRQYGIVNLADPSVTFTGTGAGKAKPSRFGSAGDLRWAIQGNVLTGDEVVFSAEEVFLATQGDLSERCLAAMKSARAWGGDGRCSCKPQAPTSCGCPPPVFKKSAHSGFMIIARIGDSLGVCNKGMGCATGTYFLDLNVLGQIPDPDPVRQLEEGYLVWRASMAGLVDQVNSTVRASAVSLPADGVTTLNVSFAFADLERAPIVHGGHVLRVEPLNTPTPVSVPGAFVDHGDGTYDLAIRAGTTPGIDTWRVIVTENGKDVALQPDIVVRVDPAASLHCGQDTLSATDPAQAPLTLDFGASAAGAKYGILASASGSIPGTVFQGKTLPLNVDAFFAVSRSRANSLEFQNTAGQLDGSGRALAVFAPRTATLAPWVGHTLTFAALAFDVQPGVAGPVTLDVVP
ncbi:MAG: DUF1028 domain-containing protein [Planctomycetes bacterium]|nr:DUF1028 domain-containing protein [Planctomycetota bacterium]